MSDSRWEQVKDVFQAALEKSPGAERERYLSEACGADTDLRGEVLALLASFEEADDFLDESPISEVAETIVGKRESLVAGQQFGRYRIERKLGAGGMGEVFLARDTELERPVALKILSEEFSANPDRVRRFVQEARAASALNHPNILTIYEIGQCSNLRFIATEYVDGETLRDRLRRESSDLPDVLDIFAQSAAALNAAHRAGIVHRDIKPENIMIRADNLVKVLDFGLAKLIENEAANGDLHNLKNAQIDTTPGLVMGTIAYMSPEQARGLATDRRTDIWSLGVCLSEVVNGVQPFPGETTSDQIAAILKSEPEPRESVATPALKRIVEKCLAKNVAERYQTMSDFLLDVNNFRKETEFSAPSKLSFSHAATRETLSEIVRLNGKQTVSQTELSTQIKVSPRASSAEYVVGEIKKHRFLSFAAFSVAAVALGLILYFSIFNSFARPRPINSLAVLSFADESKDADAEYLSDGLSESLINKFSQIPQLKVASRSSAFKYKGKAIDLPEIARALGVEAIVTGRVTRRGDDLQISVELIKTNDNTQIWGETYRRKISDAQTIQGEIARAVLQKLQLKTSDEQTQNFNSPITSNAQAYQLYLNGVFFRRQNGPENARKAIEYQNQAIALDPNFALAYAEIGFNYYNLVAVGLVDSKTGLPPAREAIEKALSLNDALAEAHDINSSLKAAEYDWAGAETEIRRAIELNPNLATAHTYYAEMLSQLKRFDEALREIRRAQELDPLRVGLVGYEAGFLFRARRYDEAMATYEKADPEASNETFALIERARIAAVKNLYPQAMTFLRKSLEKNETTMGLIYLGRLHALTGERGQALAVLERLKEIERAKELDKYVSPTQIAVLYDALGMREAAFESLERAYTESDLLLPLINVEPEYDALRDDPRFQDLLRRINLSR